MRALVVLLCVVAAAACKKEQALAAPAAPREAPKGGAATLFEETWWGQSEEELLAIYGKERTKGEAARFGSDHPPIIFRRKIEGLSLEVALHARGASGLTLIELSGLTRYPEDDDGDGCKSDAYTLEHWLRPRAGAPRHDFSSWRWSTPTSDISVFCDEGLGATFEPAAGDAGER
ncbi:MAG: hypothetical protein JNK82_00655 [Myxococcaceae bacterium]|nr:hypothetical protein [Myxococcaceae bacterium]